MTTPVRFSIATPTLNALAKLRRCVGSIRGQGEAAVEHLIQDAMSSDGTGAWLARQEGLLARVEPDGGMYDAINRAWRRSRGDILSWLNADEQYLPGTLETVFAQFAAHPQVDVLFGDYIVVDAQGRPVALRREIPCRGIYIKNTFLNLQSCTLFFRRRLLDQGLLHFDPALRYAADQDLILRLAAAAVKIRRIPAYLALFGIDGTNLSTHPRAREESESLRRKHGALRSAAARALVAGARRLERLARGGYRREAVVYRYAMDEVPHYVECSAASVGGRYALSSTAHPGSTIRVVQPPR
jgi:glycosyltransferase involved in cell wall biosynthesis